MAEATTPPVPLPDPEKVQSQASTPGWSPRRRIAPNTSGSVCSILIVVVGVIAWLNVEPAAGDARDDQALGAARRPRATSSAPTNRLPPRSPNSKPMVDIAGKRQRTAASASGSSPTCTTARRRRRRSTTSRSVSRTTRKRKGLPQGSRATRSTTSSSSRRPIGSTASCSKVRSTTLRKQLAADHRVRVRRTPTREPKPSDETVAVLRTSDGDVFLHFYKDLAPKHVENFLMLARKGFFNGTAFYYVAGGNKEPVGRTWWRPLLVFLQQPEESPSTFLRWGTGTDRLPGRRRSSRDTSVFHRPGVVTAWRDADC